MRAPVGDKAGALTRLLNLNSVTTKRVADTYFVKDGKTIVPYHTVVIPLNSIPDENEYIRVNCERGHWSRVRFSDRVVYYFENDLDALALTMRFR